jgi:hypothetical protein
MAVAPRPERTIMNENPDSLTCKAFLAQAAAEREHLADQEKTATTKAEVEQAREEATEWAQYGELDHETELQGAAVRASAGLLRRMAAEPAAVGRRAADETPDEAIEVTP